MSGGGLAMRTLPLRLPPGAELREAPGCIVRTTAELLLALLPDWHFGRASDPATGFAELTVRPR